MRIAFFGSGATLCALALSTLAPRALASEVEQQTQLWLGYLTQARLSESFGLWNDAHFVPGGFYILRTGLSYRLAEGLTATAGYAYLGLPVGGVTRDLKRREHRPWAQLVYSEPLGSEFSWLGRFRYDARLRRNVESGALAPGYSLTHRPRLLLNVRRDLPEIALDTFVPYVSAGNELLVHAGGQGTALDQNRVILGFGVARGSLSVQASYMNRLVLVPASQDFVMNHTLVLWVFQNFDLRSGRHREVPETTPGAP